jgi:type IV secretory pathway TrbL component
MKIYKFMYLCIFIFCYSMLLGTRATLIIHSLIEREMTMRRTAQILSGLMIVGLMITNPFATNGVRPPQPLEGKW